jgi:ADP-ribosylglycohydrolase
MAADQEMAYRLGCDAAAVTHGHPDGIHSAGLFAALISGVMQGYSLRESYEKAAQFTTDRMREVVERGLSLGESGVPDPAAIEDDLGGGWVGDEALAIAVACAVGTPDYPTGVLAAVNHSGDTDSTGSMCGNLLGALYGESSIPARWLEKLDGREIVASVADDCVTWTLEYPIVDGEDRETEQYFFDRYVLPV